MNFKLPGDRKVSLSLVLVYIVLNVINGSHSAFSEATLKSYLQPNDVLSGKYDFLTTSEAENRKLCTRPCDNAKSMICYYVFVVEDYNTVGPACGNCTLVKDSADCYKPQCVTADGVERAVLTINRQIPAPSIQVCPGDLIVVDIKNKMLDRAVTIHWHGLYQKLTPFMDGVPGVTQCPILPFTTFRYNFPATPFGTFFFHSHQGLQKMDGIVGSLIIRRPRSEDPMTKLYDYDLPSHVILISDWLHTMMDTRLPGNRFQNTGAIPDAILANGKTQYFYPNGTGTKAPYSVFKVTAGKRYRFRLIGGSCSTCPILIAFEKHSLLFIASDGTPVSPVIVDSVALLPGERFDVVLHANQRVGSYWIQLRGLGICANINLAATYAVLQYDSSQPKSTSASLPKATALQRGVTLNPVDISNCSARTDLCLSHLNALIAPPTASILKAKPDRQIILAVDFYKFNLTQLFQPNTYHRWMQVFPNTAFSSLINNQSYVQTPFSLLTQNKELPQELVCPHSSSCGKAPQKLCECTHIIKVPLNSIVELIFIDYSADNTVLAHPLHLHGTDMFVIKEGKIPANTDRRTFLHQLKKQLAEESGSLVRTRPQPIQKDTVGNLPGGYTVVRAHFNNPGMWYFHCHFIMHTDTGMTLVFQVGDRSQFVKPPPHFPTCDNFVPAVSHKDYTAAQQFRKTNTRLNRDTEKTDAHRKHSQRTWNRPQTTNPRNRDVEAFVGNTFGQLLG